MTRRMELAFGITPRHPPQALYDLRDLGIAQHGPADVPGTVWVQHVQQEDPSAFWDAWNQKPTNGSVTWEHDRTIRWRGRLGWDDLCAKVSNNNYPFNTADLCGIFNRLDFTVASIYRAYLGWWSKPRMYRPPGLGDGHFSNGSFAAFSKADGHARLVSRRWLDYGPWRVIRDEDTDLSVVQYHDLEADEQTALQQAMPGHQWMGIRPHGGFIQKRFVWGALKPNLYDRASRTSVVLVRGDTRLHPQQMLEAAALKLWKPHADHPIDQVAFVFFDEDNMRAHLHDLWLRGLEVRLMGPGGERRVDLDYQPPPPEVPDWVKRVRDREGF